MDDDDSNTGKRKSLGMIPISKIAKQKEFVVWQEASQKFSAAKDASKIAKEKVREYIRSKVPTLKDVESLDFTMSLDGKTLQVWEMPTKKARKSARQTFLELE